MFIPHPIQSDKPDSKEQILSEYLQVSYYWVGAVESLGSDEEFSSDSPWTYASEFIRSWRYETANNFQHTVIVIMNLKQLNSFSRQLPTTKHVSESHALSKTPEVYHNEKVYTMQERTSTSTVRLIEAFSIWSFTVFLSFLNSYTERAISSRVIQTSCQHKLLTLYVREHPQVSPNRMPLPQPQW